MKRLSIAKFGEGIKITEVLQHASTRAVSKKKFIRFHNEDIETYKYKFTLLVNEGTIDKNCNYNDHIWHGMGLYYNVYFDFEEFNYNYSLYNALKAYVIIELFNRRIKIDTIGRRYSEIKRTLMITNKYDRDKLDELWEYIDKREETSLDDFRAGNISFLSFYDDFNGSPLYIEEFSKISTIQSDNPRTLPPFKSIVLFDYLIKRYIRESNGKEKEKYYLLYLWWIITTVIPMRPNEFLRFGSDPCYEVKEKSEYYIWVPRSKKQPNPLSRKKILLTTDNLRINEQIFNLVKGYNNMVNLKNEQFLCSLKIYYSLFTDAKEIPNNRVNKNKMNLKDFHRIINKFYEEVIKGVYGLNYVRSIDGITDSCNDTIVMLKPGDTRHLAFYSMFLQGFNPLTIAQIGGQESLMAQNHYLNHLGEFSDAHTLMLSKDIQFKMLNNKNNLNEVILTSDRIKNVFAIHDDIRPREIDDGLCYSRNFPNECADEFCWSCDYFVFDYENMNAAQKSKLNMQIDNIHSEVRSKLEFIKRCYQQAMKDKNISVGNTDANEITQGEIFSNCKTLAILMNREAKARAYVGRTDEV